LEHEGRERLERERHERLDHERRERLDHERRERLDHERRERETAHGTRVVGFAVVRTYSRPSCSKGLGRRGRYG